MDVIAEVAALTADMIGEKTNEGINETRKQALTYISVVFEVLITKGIVTADELERILNRRIASIDQFWTARLDELKQEADSDD